MVDIIACIPGLFTDGNVSLPSIDLPEPGHIGAGAAHLSVKGKGAHRIFPKIGDQQPLQHRHDADGAVSRCIKNKWSGPAEGGKIQPLLSRDQFKAHTACGILDPYIGFKGKGKLFSGDGKVGIGGQDSGACAAFIKLMPDGGGVPEGSGGAVRKKDHAARRGGLFPCTARGSDPVKQSIPVQAYGDAGSGDGKIMRI